MKFPTCCPAHRVLTNLLAIAAGQGKPGSSESERTLAEYVSACVMARETEERTGSALAEPEYVLWLLDRTFQLGPINRFLVRAAERNASPEAIWGALADLLHTVRVPLAASN